jgi:hypothetical protein
MFRTSEEKCYGLSVTACKLFHWELCVISKKCVYHISAAVVCVDRYISFGTVVSCRFLCCSDSVENYYVSE